MILIIESGSTNTNWRFIKNLLSPPMDFFSEGINPHYQDLSSIEIAQAETIKKIKSEGIPTKITYFGTGISSPEKAEILKNWLKNQFEIEDILVKDDLIGSAIASMGEEKGIIGILGTGSNSGYFDGEKISFQIPTLGFWLGDEGSGGHLGKSLVLAYFKNQLTKELKDKFEKRFGEITREDILKHAYSQPFPNRWFASFAKFLFDHRKDPFIYSLIKNSFESYLKEYILKYPEAEKTKIHFIGSIAFYFSDILKIVLKDHGLTCGIISEKAMPGLTLFYKKFL